MVDNLIADLKDAIREAKLAPTGKGTMVMLYGASPSSPRYRSVSRSRLG